MESLTPPDAHRIMAAYLKVVEQHAAADVYPGSVRDLPHSRETIRSAFRTAVPALVAAGELTPDLRDYLEIAYVSLADYLDDESATLLREFARAGSELAADERMAREKTTGDAWRRVSEQSRLAGQLARTISHNADELRDEFRSWDGPAAEPSG
jgi:hypothetical protein